MTQSRTESRTTPRPVLRCEAHLDSGGRFVVGTGRCGSTLLSHIFRDHPDVLSISEFFAWLEPTQRFVADVFSGIEFLALLTTPTPRQSALCAAGASECFPALRADTVAEHATASPLLLSTIPMLTDEPVHLFREMAAEISTWEPDRLASQYLRLFGWLASRSEREVWVERSAASVVNVEALDRLFPGSRYLHIARDGPSCAASMSRHRGYEEAVREGAAVGTAATTVPRYGRLWCAMILVGLRQLWQIPREQVLTIWYDDLCDSPRSVLSDVAQFFGVEPTDSWLDHCVDLIKPRRGNTAADAQLERLCRPGMRQLARAFSR
jgi:hypothetical protein